MRQCYSIEFENENFLSYKVDSIIVLEVKQDSFHSIVDIEESFKTLEWFELVKVNKNTKGMLIIGNKDVFGEEAYTKLMTEITGEEILPYKQHPVRKFKEENKRYILINMINNFARMIIEFPKIIITAVDGSIASPFWGLSLASDLRIATENTEFHLSDKRFNLHPGGALPFFLVRHIGLSRTQEIIYTRDKIDPNEALSLGLVNCIINKNHYKSDAINYANNVLEYEREYYKNAKKLIHNFTIKEYEDYLESEQKMRYV